MLLASHPFYLPCKLVQSSPSGPLKTKEHVLALLRTTQELPIFFRINLKKSLAHQAVHGPVLLLLPSSSYCSTPDSGCSCALSATLPPWLYASCSFCLEAQPPHLTCGFVPQFLLVSVQMLLDMIRGIFQNSNHHLSSLLYFVIIAVETYST